MMTDLYEKLRQYTDGDDYPFHMPGHKRLFSPIKDPYEIDITEIEGFDNLHDARGILRRLQEETAAYYGSERSYYLVNGSTCGILAALYAAGAAEHPMGGGAPRIFLARNAHKAAYHGAMLTGAEVRYLYPRTLNFGLCGDIRTENIGFETIRDKDVVFVTSPTYDGIVSDIASIADAVHTRGGILIVDEAHGAHFLPDSGFPISAVHCGADIVIQSLHKTLPSLTQTALLHVCSDRVDQRRISAALEIFETSSPSYVLMSAISVCIRFLREHGAEYFKKFHKRLDKFYASAVQLERLHVMNADDFGKDAPFAVDRSKLLVCCDGTPFTGAALNDVLSGTYHIRPEMASATYVTLLTSLMDTDEGFVRLSGALKELDSKIDSKVAKTTKIVGGITEKPVIRLPLAKAERGPHTWVEMTEAEGRIAAGFLYFYPPGIPLLAPGEEITGEIISYIKEMRALGYEPAGSGCAGTELSCVEC